MNVIDFLVFFFDVLIDFLKYFRAALTSNKPINPTRKIVMPNVMRFSKSANIGVAFSVKRKTVVKLSMIYLKHIPRVSSPTVCVSGWRAGKMFERRKKPEARKMLINRADSRQSTARYVRRLYERKTRWLIKDTTSQFGWHVMAR
jgi:hypothetical protein